MCQKLNSLDFLNIVDFKERKLKSFKKEITLIIPLSLLRLFFIKLIYIFLDCPECPWCWKRGLPVYQETRSQSGSGCVGDPWQALSIPGVWRIMDQNNANINSQNKQLLLLKLYNWHIASYSTLFQFWVLSLYIQFGLIVVSGGRTSKCLIDWWKNAQLKYFLSSIL